MLPSGTSLAFTSTNRTAWYAANSVRVVGISAGAMRVTRISAVSRALTRLSATPGLPSTTRIAGGPWITVKALASLFCSRLSSSGMIWARKRRKLLSPEAPACSCSASSVTLTRFVPGWRRTSRDFIKSPSAKIRSVALTWAVLFMMAVNSMLSPSRISAGASSESIKTSTSPCGPPSGTNRSSISWVAARLACSSAWPIFSRPSENRTMRLAPSAGKIACASCMALAISVRVVTGMEARSAKRRSSEANRSTRASSPKTTIAARSPTGMTWIAWRISCSPRSCSSGGMLSDTSKIKTVVRLSARKRS